MNVRGDEKMSANLSQKIVALTFDDGPNATTTLEVLNQLKKYKIIASFFLIADHMNEASKKSVKMAYDMGCEIANHSKTHSDMTKLSVEAIQEEIRYTSEAIQEITGTYPKFFRPPYISVNDTMVAQIDLPFICGVGGRDWEEEVTAQERAKLILDQVQDGSIILLHDFEGNEKTVEALDIIIPALQKENYAFVTVSELFKEKGVIPTVHSGIIYSNAMQTQRYND